MNDQNFEIILEGEDSSPEPVQTNIEQDEAHVENNSVSHVSGDKVFLENSAAMTISAQEVSMVNSASALTEAGNVRLDQNSVLVLANASEVDLMHSQAGTILANSVQMDESAAGILVSREVKASSIKTGLLLAGHVEGPVEALMDTPRVLFAGMAAGITMGLVVWIGNLLGRRK